MRKPYDPSSSPVNDQPSQPRSPSGAEPSNARPDASPDVTALRAMALETQVLASMLAEALTNEPIDRVKESHQVLAELAERAATQLFEKIDSYYQA